VTNCISDQHCFSPYHVVLVVSTLFCEGCVVCGANLATRVMMGFAVPPYVVLLCFALSEVKL
jgi:hypothetical protein